LRRLRDNPRTAALPVVMMTASPGIQDEQIGAIEALGATLLLGKNLSADELVRIVSERILPGVAADDMAPAPAAVGAPGYEAR
jgi:CheY-like chemotaxis protein